MNTMIPNKEQYNTIIEKFKKGGLHELCVFADFDGTLVKPYVNGKEVPSFISLLRDGDYLSHDYQKQAHEMYNHYSPILNDFHVPRGTKEKSMQEWWNKHSQLLIDSGLRKEHLIAVAQDERIQFKDGAKDFLLFLAEHSIPLCGISSSGIGEAIELFMKNQGIPIEKTLIITNHFQWDDASNAISIPNPLIHSLAKSSINVDYFDVNGLFKRKRKNVILLGDGLDDIDMIAQYPYKTALKIGFLHQDPITSKLESAFKMAYDIVLTGKDAGYNEVNTILNSVV